MSYSEVCEAVRKLQNKYDETDPFRLCKELEILVLFQHLGKDASAIKGFFVVNKRIKAITINCDLPPVIQRIIAAHELGHAILHRGSASYAFHDVTLYDNNNKCEKEANLFAAEFLLRDDEVLAALNRDNTFFTAAAELMVPAELLDFKFRLLKWKGYKMMESPVSVHGSFLKNLEAPENADYI